MNIKFGKIGKGFPTNLIDIAFIRFKEAYFYILFGNMMTIIITSNIDLSVSITFVNFFDEYENLILTNTTAIHFVDSKSKNNNEIQRWIDKHKCLPNDTQVPSVYTFYLWG